MNGRDIVGKRIIKVEQTRQNTRQSHTVMVTALNAIVLEDGTRLYFHVAETDFGYYLVEGLTVKPERTIREKNPAAVALGRLGGKKGGPARAATMTPKERSEAARKAVNARWKKGPTE